MKPFLIALALLLILPAQAEVYRLVGPDGSVTFTDQPVPGAERIELSPVSTYPPPPQPAPMAEPAEPAEPEPVAQAYRSFTIVSPAPETTIHDNQGNVSMLVQSDPPLQVDWGHRIQYMLDGEDQGEPVTTSGTTFRNVDRGSHTLSARIVDADGETLEATPAVTVFVFRASTLFPSRQ